MNPTRVPNVPVEVDWSHPLSRGLWGAYIPGGRQPLQNIAQRTSLVLETAGNIVSTRWGPGSNAQLYDNFNAPWIFGSGATTFSAANFWLGNFVSNSSNNITLSQGIYANPNSSPYATYGVSLSATTPTILLQWGADATYNSQATSAAVSFGNQSIGVNFVTDDITAYNNGAPYGSVAGGFGAINGTDTSFFVIGPGNSSASTALALNYATSLPPALWEWLNAEPFALFKPRVRRRYFVPAATTSNTGTGTLTTGALGLSGAGASTNPGSGALAIGGVTLAGSSASQSHGSGTLPLGALGLSGIGTTRTSGSGTLPLGAFRLTGSSAALNKGSGALALGALGLSGTGSRGIAGAGAIALRALGFAGTGAARTAGTGTLALGRFGLAGAVTTKLSGLGTLALRAFGLSGSTAPTNVGTGTFAIGAFRLSTANLIPAPQITYPPSVRVATPLGRPPVAWWSPRVSGDAEPFTVDFSPLLAAGEVLTGTPTVTVPSADLTVGAITASASAVTFGLSGVGTMGQYSTVQASASTSNGQAIMVTAHVLTTPFLAGLPDPAMDIIAIPAPYFLPRAAGDTTSLAVSFTEWLEDGEAITGATISCITGDLAITAPIVSGSVVAWAASGLGTLWAPSAFLLSVTTNLRGPVGFYSYTKTEIS